MTFTAGEMASIANASLDYYFNKGDTFKQTIQAKPLLRDMEAKKKTFSGGGNATGTGDISLAVKGVYGAGGTNDGVVGYTHNDTVAFYTPANIQRANYPWREHHIGLTMTHTELKVDGLSVVDTDGASTSAHSKREMHVLVNLLNDKLEDLGEQYARTMNALMWDDGTGDAKALAGLTHIIADAPATGVVGGIDRANFDWWRNLSQLNVASAATDGGVLVTAIQNQWRQLIRYGGRPNRWYAGSDLIAALETEMRANGYYSQAGFQSGGDMSVGQMKFMGVDVMYDPTLDDLSKSKYMYLFDDRHIFLEAMDDEWRRQHTPARPSDQFVLYRSITSTGQVVARQCNSALVMSIA